MKPQAVPSTREVLAGLVERVTYHNAENGFCVLRAKARGHRDLVTVVGHAAAIAAGEWITASGEWVNDRTHGQQFKAGFLRTSPPTSADGIELARCTPRSSCAPSARGYSTSSRRLRTDCAPVSARPRS
jgi:exodeoxyribonuclease V alpha subunit